MNLRHPLLLLSFAAACGPAAPTAPAAPGAVSNSGGAPVAYVAWTRGEDGKATSRWLDAAGNEQGHTDGIVIAGERGLWRVVATERTITGPGCQEGDDGSIEPGTGTITDLSLAPIAGGEPLVLFHGPEGLDEVAELTSSVTIDGQLGRYLVLAHADYDYACGAHGSGSAGASVFDLASGAAAEPLAAEADVAHLVERARAALVAEEVDGDGEPHLGTSLPVWRDGRIALRHLMWADTCYACSNGEWSSYTSGVWVEDARVPARVRDEASQIPPAVARAIDDAGGERAVGVGWGHPDETWRATFTP